MLGFAFNNGYAYFSGYGNGGGIAICTIEASGFLYPCTISPSLTGILRRDGGPLTLMSGKQNHLTRLARNAAAAFLK